VALKVLMHDNVSQAENHAKAWFEHKRYVNHKNPSVYDVDLYGIAQHTARFPVICDDCGETFWANDPYATHSKCSKGRESRVGF
jgi:formylmethanofuran dehydrogenase subunit E